VRLFIQTSESVSTQSIASQKFNQHACHRTGAMGAVYRFQFYNWNFDQVYKEMKQYDFYTSWGHGAFKDFVKDYAREREAQIQQSKPTEK
jgi:hypothetical protein